MGLIIPQKVKQFIPRPTAPNFTSRQRPDGWTIQTEWFFMKANTICSINIIPTARCGGLCTGAMAEQDMIHWEHLPIALCPDSLGYIFSGSAVWIGKTQVDLAAKESPLLVAIFTYHNLVWPTSMVFLQWRGCNYLIINAYFRRQNPVGMKYWQ